MLITHDLGVVAGTADRVAVMYAGRQIEVADVDDLFARPRHAYTAGLLASLPRLDRRADARSRLFRIEGQPPSLVFVPDGCAFHPRCPIVRPECSTERLELQAVGPGHRSACRFPEEAAGLLGGGS